MRDVLLEKKQADLTISLLLQSNKTWGARDRNFIADNAYHIIRFKRLFEYLINEEYTHEICRKEVLESVSIIEKLQKKYKI